MATETPKITLAEFGPRQVWYVSTGQPAGETIDLFWEDDETGEETAMDPCDMESALPDGWTDLEGAVNETGEWEWDGEGNPHDYRSNTVQNLKAFADTD